MQQNIKPFSHCSSVHDENKTYKTGNPVINSNKQLTSCSDHQHMSENEEAPLPQSNCVKRDLSWNHVNCFTAVKMITLERLAVGNDLEGDARSSELPLF